MTRSLTWLVPCELFDRLKSNILSCGGKIHTGNFGTKIVMYHVGSFGADDVGDVVKDGHAKNELKC